MTQNKEAKNSSYSYQPQRLMSVILITPDSYNSIRNTIRALQRQTIKDRLEIVIVGPFQKTMKIVKSDFMGFAGYQIIEIGPFTSTAASRAAGVKAAKSSVIAFTEEHCFLAPHWAEFLVNKHRENWTGVGPVFRNANPDNAVSWANFLIEYGTFADPIIKEQLGHIPGHNSSYNRNALMEYGSDLPYVLEAESPMQWDMMTRGHTFCIEPNVKTYHLNFSKFFVSLSLRFHGGRLFASHRSRHWSLYRRFAYLIASPLIPWIRLLRIIRIIILKQQQGIMLIKALPILIIFLLYDGLGEMFGYIAGSGNANRVLSHLEFNQERSLSKHEKKQFTDIEKYLNQIYREE